MALYGYICENGHRDEVRRPMADRNEPFPCEDCPGTMRRAQVELAAVARVVSGTRKKFHPNNAKYTRGLP